MAWIFQWRCFLLLVAEKPTKFALCVCNLLPYIADRSKIGRLQRWSIHQASPSTLGLCISSSYHTSHVVPEMVIGCLQQLEASELLTTTSKGRKRELFLLLCLCKEQLNFTRVHPIDPLPHILEDPRTNYHSPFLEWACFLWSTWKEKEENNIF